MKNIINKLAKYYMMPAVILLFAAALGGCGKSDYGTNGTTGSSGTGSYTGSSNSSANQVVMQNSSFNPSGITVTQGTTVTWTNKDGYAHTVTSGTPDNADGKFDSGTINSGGTYSYTFTSAGTYNYFCRFHASMMTGTVTVR